MQNTNLQIELNKIQLYVNRNKSAFLEEFKEFVQIPSISTQAVYKKSITEACVWLQNKLEQIGMNNVQLLTSTGNPVVYGQWLNNKNAPTILIYGHYDVQPIDPIEDWEHEPFDPIVKNNNLFGRGTSDNKGQIFANILAVETLLKTYKTLPVNIKWLIEGEEEVGSSSLKSIISDQKNKQLLDADLCYICDAPALNSKQLLIEYGLRGIVHFDLDINVLDHDVHSGIYGGNVPNAIFELAKIITSLKDVVSNKILINEIYDNVRELSQQEKVELQNLPRTTQSVLSETGAKELVGWDLNNTSITQRMGALPSLDIHGFSSGYTQEGEKTVIPAKATMKFSIRTVPNMTSEQVSKKVKQHLQKVIPNYVQYNLKVGHSGEPVVFDTNSKFFNNIGEVCELVFGDKPLFELCGGTLPVVAQLKKHLNLDVLMYGYGLPSDDMHAPNENFNLDMFYKGIVNTALYFQSLSIEKGD